MNRNRCYCFSCDFPITYVNGCPESKTLSLKYQHLLLKSKHCFIFLKKTLPCMKIWRWRCNRYLRNHGFMQCEKFEYLKFRHTKVIHKNFFWVFLKCIIVSHIYEHVHHKIQGSIILEDKLAYNIFWGKLTTVTFVKVLRPMILKCLNEKKPYRESS